MRLFLFVPAERMKMRRPHVVPLSRQAIAVLERAGKLFGTDGLIFPSVRDFNKPMSDNAMNKALRDMGYKGKATPHGFRASFSSMAYRSNKFPSEVIEMALAHEEKNKIKGAYNRAEYLEQRRQLLQWWGNKLQALEYGAEVIPKQSNETIKAVRCVCNESSFTVGKKGDFWSCFSVSAGAF